MKYRRRFKQYTGSRITAFRMRLTTQGQRGMAGEHLYAQFLEASHEGLSDIAVKIIDKKDILTNW